MLKIVPEPHRQMVAQAARERLRGARHPSLEASFFVRDSSGQSGERFGARHNRR